MAAAAPALMVASAVMGGISANAAARGAARADMANARQAEQGGADEELAIRARLRAMQGDALVAEGMNGAELGSGSAIEALRQNALNANMDILSTRTSAASRAYAYRSDAASKRAAGRAALIGGLIGAGAQALGGAAKMNATNGPQVPGGTAMPIPSHYGTGGA